MYIQVQSCWYYDDEWYCDYMMMNGIVIIHILIYIYINLIDIREI